MTYYYVSGDGQRMGDGAAPGGRMGPQGGRGEGGYGGVQVGSGTGGQGSSQGPSQGPSQGAVPPSYDDAVKGDHKVQT